MDLSHRPAVPPNSARDGGSCAIAAPMLFRHSFVCSASVERLGTPSAGSPIGKHPIRTGCTPGINISLIANICGRHEELAKREDWWWVQPLNVTSVTVLCCSACYRPVGEGASV